MASLAKLATADTRKNIELNQKFRYLYKMPKTSLELSIVIPVLNEEQSLPHLMEKLQEILQGLVNEYEIIFVDDGSTDNSAKVVENMSLTNPRIKLLSFSRNFGHQIALSAGMDFAKGNAVIFMDADLQHPPDLIPQMIKKWQEGNDIVYTLRKNTKGISFFKNTCAELFYSIFRQITRLPLESNAADFRLLDKKIVAIFKAQIRERTRFLRGLTTWVGYKSCAITYTANARFAGHSKYGLNRMLLLAIDGISSFSVAPLYLGVFLGFIFSLLGFGYAVFALLAKLFSNTTIPGWSSIAILVSIIGGLQLILLGILGVYVGKIYEEVKQRPMYLLSRSIGFTE